MREILTHCVFWHPPLRTSINFFSNLNNSSSSVGSDHMGQPSQPACNNEPWPPMTLSPVHHCSFLGPLLIDTNHCRHGCSAELQFWRCSDPVVQPSQFGPCQTCSNPYTCPFFLLLTHQFWGQHVHLLPNTTNRWHDEEIISVIHSTCLWS